MRYKPKDKTTAFHFFPQNLKENDTIITHRDIVSMSIFTRQHTKSLVLTQTMFEGTFGIHIDFVFTQNIIILLM